MPLDHHVPYHLGVGFGSKPTSELVIQDSFPRGAGYARYAPNCWILVAKETASEIADAVRKVLPEEDSIFVCKIDVGDRNGYLQKDMWDWINSYVDPLGE